MQESKDYLKLLVIFLGSIIIGISIHSVLLGSWSFIGKIILVFGKVLLTYALPFMIKIILWSIGFIWQPILIYIVISLITVSHRWRVFLGIVTLCLFIILLKNFYLNKLSISNLHYILMYLMQIYLFSLWVIPKEIWNFISGFFWMIGSVIITVFPDLPTYFDDLGMIFGLFTFVFLYLHTIAMFIQRVVDVNVVKSLRRFFGITDENEAKPKYGE